MVNCIFGSFIKGLDKYLVQGPEIACGGPVWSHHILYGIEQFHAHDALQYCTFKLNRYVRFSGRILFINTYAIHSNCGENEKCWQPLADDERMF